MENELEDVVVQELPACYGILTDEAVEAMILRYEEDRLFEEW